MNSHLMLYTQFSRSLHNRSIPKSSAFLWQAAIQIMFAALDYVIKEIALGPQNRKVQKYLDKVTQGQSLDRRKELQDLTHDSLGS